MQSFPPQGLQAQLQLQLQLQPLKDSNSNRGDASDDGPNSTSVSPRKSQSKSSSASTSSRASLGKENVEQQEDRNDQDLELVRIYKSSLLRDATECKRIDTIQSIRDPSGRHFVPFQHLHHDENHGATSTRIQPRRLHRHTHDVTNCNKTRKRGNSFASTEASAFDAK
jgi:hypothetical protein